MRKKYRETDYEAEIIKLRKWIEALTRRVEDLEATTFQLIDEEEVLLVTTPREGYAPDYKTSR